MGLPDVIIALLNGTLGQLFQLNDKTTGKILTGVSNGDIVAGTPFIVNSLNDAKNKGLTEATNAFAYKVVKEFYDEAMLLKYVHPSSSSLLSSLSRSLPSFCHCPWCL